MSTGIIIQHIWKDQVGVLEKKAHLNIMRLIDHLPNNIPVLSYDIQLDEFSNKISKKFINLETFFEKNIIDLQIKEILRNWALKNKLKCIYIAGLHFNCCVMQCTTKLKEICYEEKLDWCNNFIVKVIEECTISQNNENGIMKECQLKDTTMFMDYTLVKPWLISLEEAINNVDH